MKVSIVIPTYNQSAKLLLNLKEKILPFFDATGVTYSILIEADHSSKEEVSLLEEGLQEMPAHVKLDGYEDRKGKGWAVKKGILHSDGDYVLFFDADLATDLSVFSRMIQDAGKYDAYIASRDVEGALYVRKQPFKRRLTHWGAKTIIRMKFGMKEVHDTQCGFKMFPLPAAKAMEETTHLGKRLRRRIPLFPPSERGENQRIPRQMGRRSREHPPRGGGIEQTVLQGPQSHQKE